MGLSVLRRSPRGFTLIELLTVLLIIAILLAVAVPLLLRSRVAANEAAAIGALRVLQGASEQFRAENKRYGSLAELGTAQFVSGDLATGRKTGYLYDVFVDMATWTMLYHCEAVPQRYKNTGLNSYYVDESGVIRYRDTGGNEFVPRADAETWNELSD